MDRHNRGSLGRNLRQTTQRAISWSWQAAADHDVPLLAELGLSESERTTLSYSTRARLVSVFRERQRSNQTKDTTIANLRSMTQNLKHKIQSDRRCIEDLENRNQDYLEKIRRVSQRFREQNQQVSEAVQAKNELEQKLKNFNEDHQQAQAYVNTYQKLAHENRALLKSSRQRQKEDERLISVLQCQVKDLKQNIASSSRARDQIADDVLRDKLQKLGNDVQNWVIAGFRSESLGNKCPCFSS